MMQSVKQTRKIACRRLRPARKGMMPGFVLVEALVASLILALSVMAMISLWYFSFGITTKADNVGAAYTVGRHAMERVKLSGFDFAAEGTTTLYYDHLGGSESATQGANSRMRVVTSVSSQGGYPSYSSYRTVKITVTLLDTGETLYTTGAELVKRGI